MARLVQGFRWLQVLSWYKVAGLEQSSEWPGGYRALGARLVQIYLKTKVLTFLFYKIVSVASFLWGIRVSPIPKI